MLAFPVRSRRRVAKDSSGRSREREGKGETQAEKGLISLVAPIDAEKSSPSLTDGAPLARAYRKPNFLFARSTFHVQHVLLAAKTYRFESGLDNVLLSRPSYHDIPSPSYVELIQQQQKRKYSI